MFEPKQFTHSLCSLLRGCTASNVTKGPAGDFFFFGLRKTLELPKIIQVHSLHWLWNAHDAVLRRCETMGEITCKKAPAIVG